MSRSRSRTRHTEKEARSRSRSTSSARKAKNKESRPAPKVAPKRPLLPPRPATGGVKRAKRAKPGTMALREIRKYQRTSQLLLTKLPLQRLIREITFFEWQRSKKKMEPAPKMQGAAIMAIQEACEAFLVTLFEESQKAAVHAKRVTLQQKDMKFIQQVSALFLCPDGAGRWDYQHATT